MLQWMGGSRRKVTTSRKSTQNRQKQYFEQKKRQQQHLTAGLESYADHKEHRSLDILSLLNLSTTAQELRSPSTTGREDVDVNASRAKYHMTEEPPKTFTSTMSPVGSVKWKDVEFPAGDQVQTLSPKETVASVTASDNFKDAFDEGNYTSDVWKSTMEQEISVFDLLGDDGLSNNFERSPGREAHVAFSVDGLGKVGTQTPEHSPQTPGRIFQHECSSLQKVERRVSSLKDNNYLLDFMELEVDLTEKDVNMPLNVDGMEFSTGIMNSKNILKQLGSIANNCTPFDGHDSKIKSPFSDSKTYYDDLWDARSDILDSKFYYGKEDNVCGENWPCQMDGIDYSNFGSKVFPEYGLEGLHLRKDRCSINTDIFSSVLESPSSKHQTSETDGDFVKPKRSRYHAPGSSKCIKEISQPDLCYREDLRDDLSLPSEESCSSSAVWGEATKNASPNCMRRRRRRHKNAFVSNRNMYGLSNMSAEDTRHQKCPRWPTFSKSEQFSGINFPSQEKYSPPKRSLFEKGYDSVDTILDFSPFCQASERQVPCEGSNLWTKDAFCGFPVRESCINIESFIDGSMCGESVGRSHFCSSLDEKFILGKPLSPFDFHNSPTCSKIEFEPLKPNLSLDAESGDTTLDSFHVAGSHGETQVSNMFDGDNNSKLQAATSNKGEPGKQNFTKNCLISKNGKAVEASYSKEKIAEFEEAKDRSLETKESLKSKHSFGHAEETSSSVKIPDKPKSDDDDKECRPEAETSLHWKNGIEETEKTEAELRKIQSERRGNHHDSSNQVMMLGSYVLQFLCVQKVLKDASEKANMKDG